MKERIWVFAAAAYMMCAGGGALAQSGAGSAGAAGVGAPTLRAGAVRVNPVDGAEMVYVPGGEFLMGDSDITALQIDNKPHKVHLSAYWVYRNVVTVAQYRVFCHATNRLSPGRDQAMNGGMDDHPVVNVTWYDAMAYAKWAHADLPTEAQWEKAARGIDGRKFPWGGVFDGSKLWCSKRAIGDARGTHRVGELGVSPYGCTDMAGNVGQWCRDWYDDDYWSSTGAQVPDPENKGVEGDKKFRVVRGGSWFYCNPDDFRTAYRFCGVASGRMHDIGFRCVVNVPAK